MRGKQLPVFTTTQRWIESLPVSLPFLPRSRPTCVQIMRLKGWKNLGLSSSSTCGCSSTNLTEHESFSSWRRDATTLARGLPTLVASTAQDTKENSLLIVP